ncbi:MAG TPA: hypothetical protein VGM29_06575, partial [Polyangiaceae bacterium]
MATSESSKPEAKAAGGASVNKGAGTQKSTSKPPATVRRVDEEEPTPVIGGRFLGAAVILGLMVLIPASPLGNMFEPSDPPGTDTNAWQTGNKSSLILTVVTADAA